MSIVSLEPAWIPELSEFLLKGFPNPPAFSREFGDPEVLRWKYFDPCGNWNGPRSFVVRDKGQLVGHIGFCPTEFCSADPEMKRVPTFHTADWLTAEGGSGQGGILLLTAINQAPTQYALGASASATRVLTGIGYKEISTIPIFQKVIFPWRWRSWREVHGASPFTRRMTMLAADLAQSLRPRAVVKTGGLDARRVTRFGDDVLEVIKRCKLPIAFTSRDPARLNHCLRHPKGYLSGWRLEAGGELRGFAVLSVMPKRFVRQGRIVECFLSSGEANDWTAAIRGLESRLIELGSENISCFASTPWLTAALRQNGFFRRGRVPFSLRDPGGLVRTEGLFHITQLEADAGYN